MSPQLGKSGSRTSLWAALPWLTAASSARHRGTARVHSLFLRIIRNSDFPSLECRVSVRLRYCCSEDLLPLHETELLVLINSEAARSVGSRHLWVTSSAYPGFVFLLCCPFSQEGICPSEQLVVLALHSSVFLESSWERSRAGRGRMKCSKAAWLLLALC